MSVKISNINIVCDAALDQDVNQEIGFLGEDEWKAKLDYKNMNICSSCNNTKIVESNIPMEGNEECYFCKDINE